LYICSVFQIERGDKYTEKMKMIKIEHGGRKQIMAALGVTYPTVRAALNYECDTDICRKIRTYAIRSLKGKVLEY